MGTVTKKILFRHEIEGLRCDNATFPLTDPMPPFYTTSHLRLSKYWNSSQSIYLFKAWWSVYAPPGLTHRNVHFVHTVCVCMCVCMCSRHSNKKHQLFPHTAFTDWFIYWQNTFLPHKLPKYWLYVQPVMQISFSVQGRAMPTAHHRGPTSIPSKPIWGLFVDKVALEQDYFWPIRFYSVSATPPILRTSSSSCSYQMDERANAGNFQPKQYSSEYRR